MVKPTLFTSLSPSLLSLYDLQNSVVVVIDVFRATSTIAAAIYNGAKAVIPVDSIPKAIEISKQIGGIAAGERDGKLADGMIHGNSPMEYPRTFIEDKTLVLTTTNGTRLLQMAIDNDADDIITGSFPNLGAVSDYIRSKNKNVILACAGWKDRVNIEDLLFAGAVIAQCENYLNIHCDSSFLAKSLYQQNKEDLLSYAQNLTHYHRLVSRFGYIDDIQFCLTENIANVLTKFDGKIITS